MTPLSSFGPFLFQMLINTVLEGVVFVFFCLATRRAFSGNHAALTWMVPMLIGFGLRLFGSLWQFVYGPQWHAISALANPSFMMPWYIAVSRFIYPLALSCFAFGAFRLWQTMRWADVSSHKEIPFVPSVPQEGVWPPPPTRDE